MSAETRLGDVSAVAGDAVQWGAPPADPPEQQQADALVLVAETALVRGMDPGMAGERDQVVVHVDAAVHAGSTTEPCTRRAIR